MEKNLVSIIIPAYNAQQYIERCLNSVVTQTHEKIEVLVIDDGSSDKTGAICDAYAAKDGRIKVLHVENGGVSRARNYGLEKAAGEYVMFVDSDDYVTDDYVEKHYEVITSSQTDWAITGYYICYPGKREENRIDKKYEGSFRRDELGQNFLWLYQNYFLNSPWNKIYKKALITAGFCTDMALGEDLYFNMDYMEQVSSVSISDQCCYYYMCDEQKDSLTKRINRGNFQNEMKNFHRMLDWSVRLNAKDLMNLHEMYVRNTIAMLFGLARKQIPSQEKKKIIKELCQDEPTREAMKLVRTDAWKTEILRRLLAKGRRGMLLLILSVVRFL